MSLIDSNAALPLISFERVMADDLPPVAWLVDPLIAEGDRVIVYGEFGSMKSWLLLDLSLHVAAGRPWLGKFPVPAARSVLYIDEEMNQRTLRRRIKRLALGAGLDGKNLPFQVASRVGVTFGPTGAKNLLAALGHAGFDPDIIVVETFRRVHLGSENEAEDVAAFWRNVEPLLRAGKTLIVSHHMRKPKSKRESQRDRASGSTDILAGTDSALAVQRTKPGVVRVECVKSREAEEADGFVVRLTEGPRMAP
jgi:RecA-family ATPase